MPQFSKDKELAARIESNTAMYLGLIADAADGVMPPPTLPPEELPEDVYDVLLEQVRCGVLCWHRRGGVGQGRAEGSFGVVALGQGLAGWLAGG